MWFSLNPDAEARAYEYEAARVSLAEREEATAIACAMRDAVEQGKSVALITPDRDLSRRVSAALDRWLNNSVQQAAMRQFRQSVVEIKQISAYSCRGRNSKSTGKLTCTGPGRPDFANRMARAKSCPN